MDVVILLESKTRCLRRFLEISENFEREFDEGGMGRLAQFDESRENAIRALELIDRKISSEIALLPAGDRPSVAKRAAVPLAEQECVIQAILSVDERIMRRIESEKTRLLDEVNSSRKAQSQIGKFKSAWIPESGEELDRKL